MKKLPRDPTGDYTREMAEARRAMATSESNGTSAAASAMCVRAARCSFDPAVASGNVESFVGVAQVPVGLAGPLLVRGEHVDGEVHVPMATT